VIVLLWKHFWKTRLGICIYKTSLPHRPDNYISFTWSCSPHILQQSCAHADTYCYVGNILQLYKLKFHDAAFSGVFGA